MDDWTQEIRQEERVYEPVHPGEVIEQEWLEPLGITAYQLAKAIGVPRQRLYAIVRGERAITADTALRLGRWSGMRPSFFLGLQNSYDLQMAEWSNGKEIEETIEPLATA
jgi:addiction module HigA family antidote